MQHQGGHDIHGRRLQHLMVQVDKTDAVLPEVHTHHVTSWKSLATTTTILQLAATLDDVMSPSKEGQAWILLWDMARILASEATLAAVKAAFPHVVLCFPPRSTSHACHSPDDLFSRHIEPEPAPEDPVDWAMAEASDDEDDAPMPDLIDMPLAPASARPMSNLERCIALLLVYGAGPR